MGAPAHEHVRLSKNPEAIKQAPILTLYALVIGVNTYKNFSQLSGAVKDAESIYDFLRFDLSVPESQITKLTNEQATRVGIINAMESLSGDSRIRRYDPILIFYAGHGCEVDSPLENYKGKAQCLVPWDVGDKGADGQSVSPIPDYTISALLNELAMKKGNNITVIFDSCHSASSTRGIRNTSAKTESGSTIRRGVGQPVADREGSLASHCRSRSLNLQSLPPLTLETDKAIIRRVQRRKKWRTIITFVRSHLLLMHIATGHEHSETGAKATSPQQLLNKTVPGLVGFFRSHVLLAACGHAEQAYECSECHSGFFTSALLQVFRFTRLGNLRYKRCFEEFPALLTHSPQNPVCEGITADRPFFASTERVLTSRSASFTMQQLSKGYLLKLGDAQGVFPGSTYGIYEDHTVPRVHISGGLPSPGLDRPLWGSFLAYPYVGLEPMLYPFYSQCKLDTEAKLPSWPRAKLLKLGRRGISSLKVFISDAFKLKHTLDPDSIVSPNQGMVLVHSVAPDDKGTVVLDIESGNSENITFSLVGSPGVLYRCLPDAKSVRDILISMAQWRWHRSREPQTAQNYKIAAELTIHELGAASSDPSPLPVGEEGSISVKVSQKTLYALKLKSRSSRPLYPYLFYFSTMKQSIRPLYLGVYGSRLIDPPLEPKGELTFGYNNDDMIQGPLSFSLLSDEGYFQLFLTTSPCDFDSLAQLSPFTPGDGDGLEIRYHSPIDSNESQPWTSPATSPGAYGDRSAEILVTKTLEIGVAGSQQSDASSGLEDSSRGALSEAVVIARLAGHDIQQWGVISLKVKCKKADA